MSSEPTINDAPKILIMGLGGIGGLVSAHLIEQGANVAPVTRNEEIARALSSSGYRIREDGEERSVHGPVFTEIPNDARGFDFVLLAMQPPQIEQAVRTVIPCLAPTGKLVCFPNGLCEERIEKIAGSNKTIGAIIAWGASMIEPGVYERTSGGGFTVGVLDAEVPNHINTLSLLLESVGPVEITKNLRGARWSKLALNCAVSTLGTIAGERLGVLLAQRFVRRLALEIMSEVVELAHAENVKLEKVSGTIDLDWLRLTSQERQSSGSPGLLAKHGLLMAVGARYRRLRSSMLNAIERGREPAVDFLNGEVVERGRGHNIPTPINLIACEMVHRIAKGERSPSIGLLRQIYDSTR